ncbi:MAG: pitrilysin family protein [Planctomycetota bacterium]|nr:pitrilysin family protein [Planctomycetota bacterium]
MPRQAAPRTSSPRGLARAVELPGTGARLHEHRLRNGLRVLLVERHADPVVTSLLWYDAGARDEAPHEAGVAHFLEHMMFKGTRRHGKGQVDAITTQLGGSNNAFTSYDHTAYWFELSSDRWETALELEADRMRGLRLDEAEFRSEKAVVLEELAMGRDNPWRRLGQEVGEALYGRHPYGRPIIGFRDTLEPMGVDLMRSWYERTYHPGRATLVLCGGLNPRQALARVREHFGDLPAGPEAPPLERAPLREPEGERRLTVRWDDPAQRLTMAWRTAPVGTDEDFDLDLIEALLTGGRLSRLHRRLVLQEGLATFVSGTSDTRVEAGAFWLSVETVPGADPAAVERVVEEELHRLAHERIPASELKRVKATVRSGDAYEAETVTDLAELVGSLAVDADWRLLLDLEERRSAVTAKRVQSTLRRLFVPERRVVGWSLPEEKA